jgi:hypothetical protein
MIKLNLASPCDDCGHTGGHLNTGNVRPARLAAERFGFPPGSKVCKACYEKWRYRLRIGILKESA